MAEEESPHCRYLLRAADQAGRRRWKIIGRSGLRRHRDSRLARSRRFRQGRELQSLLRRCVQRNHELLNGLSIRRAPSSHFERADGLCADAGAFGESLLRKACRNPKMPQKSSECH